MRSMALRLVLAVAVAAGVSVPSAFAVPGVNIVKNGNAEIGSVALDDGSIVVPNGWVTIGNFTAVKYGSSGLPGLDAATAVGGGSSLFAGGPANEASSATQTVIVPPSWLKTVAAGKVKAVVSAALGGWEDQSDAAAVTYLFLDVGGKTLGSVKIGPVTPAQRASVTKLLPVSKVVPVPAKTRSVKITVAAIRGSGSYNDGYADNVSFRLST